MKRSDIKRQMAQDAILRVYDKGLILGRKINLAIAAHTDLLVEHEQNELAEATRQHDIVLPNA